MGTEWNSTDFEAAVALPGWVPPGALHYIAHTERGAPIRALARAAGCHASTIMRQIRKVEMRRDDPLVDAALRKLGAATLATDRAKSVNKEALKMAEKPNQVIPDDTTLARESMRVLRRLCENGAVLAVAADMDKAVVVRDLPGGASTRTAVVEAAVAQAMALKDWISPANTGRIIRYHITNSGRQALTGFIERFGGKAGTAPGFADAATPFEGQSLPDAEFEDDGTNGRARYTLAESPLSSLARRKGKDGKPFLEDVLVHAGEQLREDFELAQMDSNVTQNWDHFLTAGTNTATRNAKTGGSAPSAARARVQQALQELRPGLSDVVLRCCCYLEGLETMEKRLGWSARSGKVVLRIALMRLRRHYDDTVGPGGPMIG
ncbi:MAG: DUF6456 domain-containing protein [Sulfitobacter sp.]